jgi:hypothetical protein
MRIDKMRRRLPSIPAIQCPQTQVQSSGEVIGGGGEVLEHTYLLATSHLNAEPDTHYEKMMATRGRSVMSQLLSYYMHILLR